MSLEKLIEFINMLNRGGHPQIGAVWPLPLTGLIRADVTH
jgi:hypothetical protein